MDVARGSMEKATETAAAGAATLPEDVVREILARVAGAIALFRCAVACKRWRGLVSDPAFLRGRWPDPPSLAGFFVQVRSYRARGPAVASAPALVPARGSPLGRACRSLRSFVSCAAGLLDDAVPFVSRDGLLLVRLVDAPTEVPGGVRLAVCNLIAGTCDELPPLRCRFGFRINSCAVVTFADGGRRAAFFKVLLLVFNRDTFNYDLCTYSSTEPGWGAPIVCFSSVMLTVVDGGAVVRRGTAHWLVRDWWNGLYTLEMSDDASLVGTSIPPPSDRHDHTACLGVAIDGALSLLRLCKDCLRLEVWARRGEERSGDGEWLQTKAVKLKWRKKNKTDKVECLRLHERSGALFVEDVEERMYAVDLETGEMDEVTGLFWHLRSQTSELFEMDWPAFFESRLGGNRLTKPTENP